MFGLEGVCRDQTNFQSAPLPLRSHVEHNYQGVKWVTEHTVATSSVVALNIWGVRERNKTLGVLGNPLRSHTVGEHPSRPSTSPRGVVAYRHGNKIPLHLRGHPGM